MLIIFTVTEQKITHNLGSRTLVAGSSGEVQAAFLLDSSWNDYKAVVVFSNTGCNCKCSKPKPIAYTGDVITIPDEVLVEGKLYVSVIGYYGSRRKTTLKWDIQQAITVKQCGDFGDCDILRSINNHNSGCCCSATNAQVEEMLDAVFGSDGTTDDTDDDPSEDDGDESGKSEYEIATDEEVSDMLESVFN